MALQLATAQFPGQNASIGDALEHTAGVHCGVTCPLPDRPDVFRSRDPTSCMAPPRGERGAQDAIIRMRVFTRAGKKKPASEGGLNYFLGGE